MKMSSQCAQVAVKRPHGPKPEFPGITEAAATLGGSRYFLWKVLKGYATSAPLLKRYSELKQTKGKHERY